MFYQLIFESHEKLPNRPQLMVERLKDHSFSLQGYPCNVYNFHYTDDVIRCLEKVFGLDLIKRFRKRSDIRNFLAAMKKQALLHYTFYMTKQSREPLQHSDLRLFFHLLTAKVRSSAVTCQGFYLT
jgi:hypothetical protein